jgi:hypothetical protein
VLAFALFFLPVCLVSFFHPFPTFFFSTLKTGLFLTALFPRARPMLFVCPFAFLAPCFFFHSMVVALFSFVPSLGFGFVPYKRESLRVGVCLVPNRLAPGLHHHHHHPRRWRKSRSVMPLAYTTTTRTTTTQAARPRSGCLVRKRAWDRPPVAGPLGFGFCFDLFHVELFISAAFFTADSLACLTDDKHAVFLGYVF